MALTNAQKLSCFEILEACWSDSGSIENGFSIQVSMPQLNQLKAEISNRLGPVTPDTANPGYNYGLDADAEAKVVSIVADWDALGTGCFKMESGAAGAVTGLSVSSDADRNNIRKRLLTYVPVFHIADAIKRKTGPGEQKSRYGSISMMR